MDNPLVRSSIVFLLLVLFTAASWSTAPTISSTSPAKNQLNISATANITMTFDQSMDNATITTSTVKVYGSYTGLHNGNYSYGSNSATFNPTLDFKPGEVVSVTVTTGVKNSGDAAMTAPYIWSFTVATSGAEGAFLAKHDLTTGNIAESMIAADVDADGKVDLVSANALSNTISVFHNNGDRTFHTKVDYATGSYPLAIAGGDLNGDGKIDVVTSNYSDNSVSVLLNNGNGTFATKVDYPAGNGTTSVALADLDGDGDIDIVTANWSDNTVSVFLNNGNGTFATKVDYATGNGPYGVTAADVNGDGKVDLVAANYSGNSVSVLLNTGNGNFAAKADYPSGGYASSITAADVDGDGAVDLVATNGSGGGSSLSVFINNNNGTGTFAAKVDYTTAANPRGVTTADVDGDGYLDLVVGCGGANAVSVLKNNGNGTFGPKADYAAGTNAHTVVAADLNGDGFIDLAVSNGGTSSVSVLFSGYTFTVNSTSDIVAANPGDGTALTSGGSITLRSAIQEALADGITEDIIKVPAGTYTLSIAGKDEDAAATGDLDLKGNMKIIGAGENSTIIDANGIDRVFHVIDEQSKASITISNLKITGGNPAGDSYYEGGGAILLEDTVDFSLNHVTIDGNTSYEGALNIYTDAAPHVAITNSTFSNNAATSEGGAIYGYYYGSLDIENTTFSNNLAEYWGGAIESNFDSLKIASSTFTGNRVYGTSNHNVRGGAIYHAWGQLTVDSCAFEANSVSNSAGSADQQGGAIHIYYGADANVLVRNSTFRADSAFDGGAIYLYDGSSALSIDNSGFYKNQAQNNGGAIYQNDGTLTITNSTLDSNKASNRDGGAVYAGSGTGLTMQYDNVRYDSAASNNGGGLSLYSDLNHFSMKNSDVSHNYAYYSGGGIYSLSPNDSLNNVTIKHNIADESGGGIMIDYDASTRVSKFMDVAVDSNQATGINSHGDGDNLSGLNGRGGGVFDYRGGMAWDGGSLRANNAAGVGGGIFYHGNQNSTIQNTVTISGNIANGVSNQVVSGGGTGTLTTSAPSGSTFSTKAGTAVSFDGVNDYAAVYSPSINNSNGWTVEMWVKPASLPISGKMVLFGPNGYMIQMGIDSNYHFYARLRNGFDSNDQVRATGTTTVSANQWYHFAASVKSGDSVKVYVNGNQEASAYLNSHNGLTSPLCFGRNFSNNSAYGSGNQDASTFHYYAGLMDEVRIWNSVRTPSQIRTYMHATLSNSTLTDAVLYYQMNDSTGAVAHDYYSGNNLNLNWEDNILYQPAWVTSSAPVGGGSTSNVTSFQAGTQAIGNASLTMTDGFDNPVDVFVSENSGDPNVFPTNYNASVGGKYFVIDVFGNPGTFSANLSFTLGPGVITGTQESNPGTLILYKRSSTSSGGWTSYGGATSAVASTGVVTWTGITSFSQAIIEDLNDALPVILSSFTAKSLGGSVELQWSTATEVNNARFEVERSSIETPEQKSTGWIKVGTVDGQGTSNKPHDYSYTDASARGTVRYRLKQIDRDGKFKNSQEVEVHVSAPIVFALQQNYPNPFNPTTTIEFTIAKDGVTSLKIYNTLGQEVATLMDEELKAGEFHHAVFNGSQLASGVYFARLQSGAKVQMKKMLMLK